VRERDFEVEAFNQAIYWRGLFKTRYSGIEFAVSELIMRARGHPSYNSLGELPYPLPRKLKRIRDICSLDGPVKFFSDEIILYVEQFEAFEETRHFLAHAIMNYALIDGALGVKLSMYAHKPLQSSKPLLVHMGQISFQLETLHQLAESIQPVSTGFTALVARVSKQAPLPTIDGLSPNPP
jgi:hypothetical protein